MKWFPDRHSRVTLYAARNRDARLSYRIAKVEHGTVGLCGDIETTIVLQRRRSIWLHCVWTSLR
jgi:hypothetical protein